MRVLLLVVCLCLAARARAELKVTPDRAVIYEGERLEFRVSGGALTPGEVRMTSFAGAVIAPDDLSADRIVFNRLPRGYYELTVSQDGQTVVAPVAVVGKPHPRPDSRLATDAAHSWLIPPHRFEEGARLLQQAGFGWIRERLSWPEVEPQRGVFRWGRYDASADAAAKRGIRVYQVFHQTPAWARADRDGKRYPDDLRDVFHFCREAARHYQGKVQAWEVWNEADISGFSTDTAAEYAAFLKAASLGFKAGDPGVKVTQVSLALASPVFHASLYENGAPAYFDIFNYHIYADPKDYPARAKGHFDILDRYGVPRVPVWLTEAGIPLKAVNNTLTPEDRRRQAEFIPKSFAMSLASGTDRHFFFVFPHYLENGVEFGTMDADMRPYPGYAALATVTDLLGEARYRGRVAFADAPDAQAHLFDNGKDQTLVAWTDGPERIVSLPPGTTIRLNNCVGEAVASDNPAGRLRLSRSPVFALAPRGAFNASAEGLPRRNPKRADWQFAGHDLILRVRPPDDTIRKGMEGHEFRAGQPVPLTVEVYNFGAKSVHGTVRLSAPQGWGLESKEFPVDLPAGERLQRTSTLTPPRHSTLDASELHAVIVPRQGDRWGRGRPQSAPAVLRLRLDPATLEPTRQTTLDAEKSERWQDNISGNGSMSHRNDPEGGVEFDIRFTSPSDRWAYPTITFTAPPDWREYDGMSLEVAADVDDPQTQVRVILGEDSGSAYLAEGAPAARAWRRLILPFRDFVPGGFAPADPNGRLDLDQIALLRVGCNTPRDRVTLRVRNLSLVRYQ